MSNSILDFDEDMADAEEPTVNAPPSDSPSAEVPHQVDTGVTASYPPTPAQSQMNVSTPTLDSSSARGPHRVNVARQLLHLFNQPPRPALENMPQRSSGTQQGTAASLNLYQPYRPRTSNQRTKPLESQPVPRGVPSRVEPASSRVEPSPPRIETVPMQPPLSTPNPRRREREQSAAPVESTFFPGQVTAERVTKVQLIEQESLQVTEKLVQQAAAIEQLKQQLARRDQEVEEAQRLQAEAVLRIQQAEKNTQRAVEEVRRLTAQQDAGSNPMTEEALRANESTNVRPQDTEQHIHDAEHRTQANHQGSQQWQRSRTPQGSMPPGPQVTIGPQPNIEAPRPFGLYPTAPVESTRGGGTFNTSGPVPGNFEGGGVPAPGRTGDREFEGIEIDMDKHDGTADIGQDPSSDEEVEDMITDDNGRYKARVSEGSDSSDENEAGRSFGKGGSVPPPINFSRPRGGAGPVLRRAQASNIRHGQAQRPERTPPPRLLTVEEKIDLMVESLHGMEQRLENLKGHSAGFPSSRMKQPPGPFKSPPKREYSPGRTDVLGKVRKEMNYLMGIKADKDVVKGGLSPPQEALDLWENDEQGEGPALKPMKPDWSNLRSSWNSQLEDLFCAHFCKKWEIDDESMEGDVCNMFRQRLERLRRLIKVGLPRAGETPDQTAARATKTTAAALARQRPNSRRRELYFSRLDTTLANRESPDGGVDLVWDELHNIVATLGQAGMSSDESDGENPERPIYVVKKRDWRNKDLIPYLSAIDRDRNTTNAYGNTRAGNPPRYRSRKHGKRSVRLAIPGLPINFYDAGWLAGLSNGEMRSLRPGRAIALPDFEEG